MGPQGVRTVRHKDALPLVSGARQSGIFHGALKLTLHRPLFQHAGALSDRQPDARAMLHRFGKQLARLFQIIAGIDQPVDLAAFLSCDRPHRADYRFALRTSHARRTKTRQSRPSAVRLLEPRNPQAGRAGRVRAARGPGRAHFYAERKCTAPEKRARYSVTFQDTLKLRLRRLGRRGSRAAHRQSRPLSSSNI